MCASTRLGNQLKEEMAMPKINVIKTLAFGRLSFQEVEELINAVSFGMLMLASKNANAFI